jgi:hypothetical protein
MIIEQLYLARVASSSIRRVAHCILMNYMMSSCLRRSLAGCCARDERRALSTNEWLLCTQRGIVMELAGDDDFTFPADLDEHTSEGPLQQFKGFAGKTLPGKVGRQGQFGESNSGRAFGHDGAIGQIGALRMCVLAANALLLRTS